MEATGPTTRHYWSTVATAALASLLLTRTDAVFGAEPAPAEYQAKAVFLLNFAKYVDWPSQAFPDSNAPIAIGVLGQDRFNGGLEQAVAGKEVGGRAIVVRKVQTDADLGRCQILFVSNSERRRVAAVLRKVRGSPVLTVGESERFVEQGGVISLVHKEDRVRLEIDLNAARASKLKVSSKLLSVADMVRGTP